MPKEEREKKGRFAGIVEEAAEHLGPVSLHYDGPRPAHGNLDREFTPWWRRLPFFMRLRERPDGTLPTPQELTELLAPAAGKALAQWVRERLKDGTAPILLDGIDEVPEDKRPASRASIKPVNLC